MCLCVFLILFVCLFFLTAPVYLVAISYHVSSFKDLSVTPRADSPEERAAALSLTGQHQPEHWTDAHTATGDHVHTPTHTPDASRRAGGRAGQAKSSRGQPPSHVALGKLHACQYGMAESASRSCAPSIDGPRRRQRMAEDTSMAILQRSLVQSLPRTRHRTEPQT